MTLIIDASIHRTIATLLQMSSRLSDRLLQSRIGLILVLAALLSACDVQEENTVQAVPLQLTSAPVEVEQVIAPPYGRDAVFSYPDFAGKHAVGSRSMIIADPSRYENFEQDSIDNRRLHIRFYYPIEKVETVENLDTQSIQEQLPVISQNAWDYLIGHQEASGKMLRFDNYQSARWKISLEAEINTVQSNYPVLIFSHGYGYSPESYSALSAELASKGYIVISINHTYGANPTDFGNNDVIWAEPLPESIGEYLPIWSDDQIFVLDQLSLINSDSSSPFYNKLNLSNIGIFGHSYGGAAAYYTAAKDPRIKAIIDIDGTIFHFEDKYIDQPFAFILSKDHQPKFDYNNTSHDAFEIRLSSFEHISFTDHILWWQWDHDDKDLGIGTVDAHRAVELTTQLVSDFFAKYLTSESSTWFEEDEILTSEFKLVRKN